MTNGASAKVLVNTWNLHSAVDISPMVLVHYKTNKKESQTAMLGMGRSRRTLSARRLSCMNGLGVVGDDISIQT